MRLFYADIFDVLIYESTLLLGDGWERATKHARLPTARRRDEFRLGTTTAAFFLAPSTPKSAHRSRKGETWRYLRHFWPMKDVEELVVAGAESRNILPLNAHAHVMWERFRVALRPIQHPIAPPERGMYVQLVWLNQKDGNDGTNSCFVADDWNYAKYGGISDYRRDQYPPIRHGDDYELVSATQTTQTKQDKAALAHKEPSKQKALAHVAGIAPLVEEAVERDSSRSKTVRLRRLRAKVLRTRISILALFGTVDN
ncbi:uncharacterized protein SPSK_02701 [Sporothrix schenckii 1099-18]|uniref:Uncharacterized protein n=1 Tax=Sporothrix schenckii 1099-18 TaxID=1397361 RepID=A0A0F2M943_SPOSC|nr:uncharacterized protein SPSK_02701 [Sporothrix schenckii 1099-18]KJR86223.1 hypothetical protein SPSK_02701 [Sporothrix schenckii 1099-18]